MPTTRKGRAVRQFAGTLAIQRFDRTEALHDGRVVLDRVMVAQVLPGVGVRGLLNRTFDAAEIPLAHYSFLKDRDEPYTAIPVFPDRLFLQPYVLTRRGSGITSLADLAGRRVALPMYYMTSSLWHRADLEAAGVSASDVEWITTAPERDERMRVPPGVRARLVPGPHLGLERLLDEDADCLMTEALPVVPAAHRGDIVPVHEDPARAQREFFEATRCHPALHVIAVRQEFADAHPDLVLEMCRGFDRAKQAAYHLLQNERITSLPFMRTYLDETERVFGDDPFPYGVSGRNGQELSRFLDHAHRQGLTRRRLTADELFDSAAAGYPWSARMIPGVDLAGMESLNGLVPPAGDRSFR
jgi:4,5-dihydroxyphthalate decarboxylase